MRRFNVTQQGYRFDRLIFLGCFLIVAWLALYIMETNRFDFTTKLYFKCNEDLCKNPVYGVDELSQELKILWFITLYKTPDYMETCEWCKEPYLMRGEYGEQPKANFLLNNMLVISLTLIGLSLLGNHFAHNKGKGFDIEIPITKKIVINKKMLKEYFDDEKNMDKGKE